MKPIAPILLTALMIPGCATTHGDPTDSCSSKETCVVQVLVRGCSWQSIEVRPEELWVRKGYKGEVSWKLVAPPGWEFAPNGIEFKEAASREEFRESKHGAREFWWFDKNSKRGRHHYNINVIPPGGGKVCTRDPTVMNDGEGP